MDKLRVILLMVIGFLRRMVKKLCLGIKITKSEDKEFGVVYPM